MARRFTSASAEHEIIAVGAASVEVFGPCTWLAVVRRATDAWQTMMCVTTSGDSITGALKLADTGAMQTTWGVPRSSTHTYLTSDGWLLVGYSKPTGTVTPRAHKYRFDTATWTHAAMNGTQANMGAIGAGGKFWVGRFGASGEEWNGDIAAMCYISRELTDSEIKSAARGDWWRFSPRFWREYPSGNSVPAVLNRQIGRDATYDILVSGTSRSPLVDPPGFRFSIRNRRT